MKNNQKLNIRISKWYNTTGKGMSFRLEVSCAKSGVSILEAELTPDEFCTCVIGNSECDVDAWFTDRPSHVGATREVKDEKVIKRGREPNYYTRTNREGPSLAWARWAEKLCAPYEVDGWSAYYDDLHNHHRRVIGTNNYNVGMVRFVDSKGRPLR